MAVIVGVMYGMNTSLWVYMRLTSTLNTSLETQVIMKKGSSSAYEKDDANQIGLEVL